MERVRANGMWGVNMAESGASKGCGRARTEPGGGTWLKMSHEGVVASAAAARPEAHLG